MNSQNKEDDVQVHSWFSGLQFYYKAKKSLKEEWEFINYSQGKTQTDGLGAQYVDSANQLDFQVQDVTSTDSHIQQKILNEKLRQVSLQEENKQKDIKSQFNFMSNYFDQTIFQNERQQKFYDKLDYTAKIFNGILKGSDNMIQIEEQQQPDLVGQNDAIDEDHLELKQDFSNKDIKKSIDQENTGNGGDASKPQPQEIRGPMHYLRYCYQQLKAFTSQVYNRKITLKQAMVQVYSKFVQQFQWKLIVVVSSAAAVGYFVAYKIELKINLTQISQEIQKKSPSFTNNYKMLFL